MHFMSKRKPKKRLSTSEDGRSAIRICIEELGDNYLYGLIEIEKDRIKYRSRSFYSSYKH